MTDWPLVSVIVVNMDGHRHLKPCFESLVELDYPTDQVEIILVDNGSRDRSVKYTRKNFPNTQILELKKNEGFAQANNLGVERATGKYVVFLNNDMRVHSAWLRELVTAVESADDVVAVGGKILNWDGDEVDFEGGALNFHGMGFQPHHAPPPDDQLTETLFVCGGNMLVDREIFLQVGGFDSDYFAYFEDVDLGWRLWLLGYRVLYAPRGFTYHRGHGTSSRLRSSQVAVLYERNSLYSIIKNYDERNFRRVWPVALLLLVRRAMIFGRINKQKFRLPRSDSSGPPPLHTGASRQAHKAVPSPLEVYGRLTRYVRESGAWAAFTESVRLILVWIYRQIGLLLRSETTMVPVHMLSHMVAADDLIDAMPSLMEKRSQIQAQRKRSDAEILPMFNVPFQPHPPFEQYITVQKMLTRTFQVDEMFEEEL